MDRPEASREEDGRCVERRMGARQASWLAGCGRLSRENTHPGITRHWRRSVLAVCPCSAADEDEPHLGQVFFPTWPLALVVPVSGGSDQRRQPFRAPVLPPRGCSAARGGGWQWGSTRRVRARLLSSLLAQERQKWRRGMYWGRMGSRKAGGGCHLPDIEERRGATEVIADGRRTVVVEHGGLGRAGHIGDTGDTALDCETMGSRSRLLQLLKGGTHAVASFPRRARVFWAV